MLFICIAVSQDVVLHYFEAVVVLVILRFRFLDSLSGQWYVSLLLIDFVRDEY